MLILYLWNQLSLVYTVHCNSVYSLTTCNTFAKSKPFKGLQFVSSFLKNVRGGILLRLSLEMRKCWGRSRIDEVCPGGMLGSHLLFIHDIHEFNQAFYTSTKLVLGNGYPCHFIWIRILDLDLKKSSNKKHFFNCLPWGSIDNKA